jgi:hypothetical protein
MGVSCVQHLVKHTLLICFAAVDKESPPQNTMSRKLNAFIIEDCRAMVRKIVVQHGIRHNAVREMTKIRDTGKFIIIGVTHCRWSTKGHKWMCHAAGSMTSCQEQCLPTEHFD